MDEDTQYIPPVTTYIDTPDYMDIPTADGILRITYEMTIGDVIIAGAILLLLVYQLLAGVMKILWR